MKSFTAFILIFGLMAFVSMSATANSGNSEKEQISISIDQDVGSFVTVESMEVETLAMVSTSVFHPALILEAYVHKMDAEINLYEYGNYRTDINSCRVYKGNPNQKQKLLKEGLYTSFNRFSTSGASC